MYKRFSATATIVLCAALWSVTLYAQTTGSVAGTVTDATGAVLPGVTVELSGPSLQGLRSTVTDGAGAYRFRNVPPGDNYKVKATLTGFQSLTKEGIHVYLGQEGTVNLSIKAAITEAITVVGEAPLVDVTKTTTGVNITANQFESLPTARNFQQLTTIAPGVTLEMGDHDTRFATSPNVGASSAPENNYIIDGLSATDPRFGTSGANVTMNFVQEVQVMTGGYAAEYGRSTGGVFNVVTKSGGNSFHGDLFSYFRKHDIGTPDNVLRRRNKELGYLFSGDDIKDFGASLGGPIVKDKLWFFAAVDPTRKTTFVGGSPTCEPSGCGSDFSGTGHQYDTDTNIYSGKLSWTITPNHTVVATAFGDPASLSGWLGDANSEPGAAIRQQKIGGHNFSLRYSGILTSKWLLDVSGGRHHQRAELAPDTPTGTNVPRQIDETNGGFQHGGFQRFQNDKADRDSFAVKFSNFVGNHEFRYGIDTEINHYDGDLREQWYRYFGRTKFSSGVGANVPVDYIQDRSYFVQGKGTTTNGALFAQDSWKITPHLQLNLGVRYEEQWITAGANGNSVAVAHPGEDECVVDLNCRTVQKLKLKNNWSPRLGLVWDPAQNGKSKVYGFYGRFYEAIPLDMNIRAINGERYIIKRWGNTADLSGGSWINPNGSPLAINGTWTLNRTSNLTAVTPLDDNLRAQYQNEFVLGGEYQFGSQWSAGVRFVDRELKRVIEDMGTFTDPSDPTALTGYVIGNPGETGFGSVFEAPKRYYRAVEVTLQRARANNWQLYSSFVYARAQGNYEGLYISGYDQLDPNITALYDIPSFLNNAEGKLRADKPYQFKVHGSYSFPFGLTLSEGFFLSAGVPVSAQGPEIVNGYGDGTIWLKPRGSEGRTPAYWTLDLHADYAIPLFKKGDNKHLNVIVDAFNVLNRHQVLEFDQDYVYEGMAGIEAWEDPANLDSFGNPKFNPNLSPSPFYKTPILYQTPRSVQLGIKFTF